MKLLHKTPLPPVPTPDPGFDVKRAATSGLAAIAVMGALTAASAVVSSIRSRSEKA